MLGWWAELMPLFVVRWFARRYCERFLIQGVGLTNHAKCSARTARADILVWEKSDHSKTPNVI